MNSLLHRTYIVAIGIVAFVLASPLLPSQENGTQLPGLQDVRKEEGTPRLVRQGAFSPSSLSSLSSLSSGATDDDNWADGFGDGPGSNGIDDEVFALASDGIRLYIGGAFTKAGDVSANNIVSWDGERWQILGTGPGILNGVNGIVNAIAVDGDIIYVGGQFTNAGGTPVQNLARYSISSRTWANMSSGISGTNAFVSTILVDGNQVYVGGTFSRAGNASANNIAVWNKEDQRWSVLGSAEQGVAGNVNAIAKGPDGLYVGGSFSSAGGVASNSVARWDSTGWHSLAGGVNGSVNAIAVLENRVFVGGEFNMAGDTAVNNIARWYADSGSWSRLTGVMELVGEYFRVEGNGVDGVVRTITIDGNNVYVGGTFNSTFPGDLTLDPVSTSYIARWFEPTDREWWQTNTWWAPLGRGARNGTNGFVNDIAVFDGQVYAGGAFSRAGGQNADGIARWDGIRWLSLTTGVSNFIFNLTLTDDGEVYVGGEFNQTGSAGQMALAKLNGTQWQMVSGPIRGSIYALASEGDWIYVGGQFTNAGGVAARNVARWNRVTRQWSTLGSAVGPGLDESEFISYVSSITVKGDDVYLGGLFNVAGGVPANNIVRWNSAADTWTPLGSGINGSVFAMEFEGDDLYAGGRFIGAGDAATAKNIARWRDGAWQEMDTGTNNPVWAMALHGSTLYVGGEFTQAGEIDVNHLAAWDTDARSWSDPGGGVNDDFLPVINSIAATEAGRIYVGGSFNVAGTRPVSNVASWNGEEWNSMGSGVDGYVYQMAVHDNRVYVTGAFTEAGAKPSFYFGIYNDPALSVNEADVKESVALLEANSPNPFTASTTIPFRTGRAGRVSLTVHDVSGRTVARIIDNTLPAGMHRVTWQPDGVPAGVYFCRLEVGGDVQTRKMVVE